MPIEMILADCMDEMRKMPDKSFDLAIVDPPYGIGRSGKPASTSSHGGHRGFEDKGWDKESPGPHYFHELFRVSKHQIVWGANYYPGFFQASPGWILWDKGQRIDQADGELAYSSFDKPLRVVTINRVELMLDGTIHPTQKPVALYKWLLTRYAKPGWKILDTHGGSGSIAIACHDLGFDLTWIEKDPDYYEAACARYKTHAAQLHLIEPAVVEAKPLELFEPR